MEPIPQTHVRPHEALGIQGEAKKQEGETSTSLLDYIHLHLSRGRSIEITSCVLSGRARLRSNAKVQITLRSACADLSPGVFFLLSFNREAEAMGVISNDFLGVR